MQTPLYDVGNRVYLRESAAMGFLEPVVISGVMLGVGGWLYSWRAGPDPSASGRSSGDRRSFGSGHQLYLDESEIVDLCTAIGLAELNMMAALSRLQQLKSTHCPEPDGA